MLAQSGGEPFAALAAEKWLDLHRAGQPDANRHASAIRRGFVATAGDPVWTESNAVDRELLPLLNQYCFRCHSSVRYHVFQKSEVIRLKQDILSYVKFTYMPQDRKLEASTRDRMLVLLDQLP